MDENGRRAFLFAAPDAIIALVRSEGAVAADLDLRARVLRSGRSLEDWLPLLTADDFEALVRRIGALLVALDEMSPGPIDEPNWPSPMSDERREFTLRLLDLPTALGAFISARNPLPHRAGSSPLVWVDPDRAPVHKADFIGRTRGRRWSRYRAHLRDQMRWPSGDLHSLETDLDELVNAFPDPALGERSPRRLLVVGYTQSGKTANFLGLTARMADAGVRLIVVLSGRTKILRRQTQARIDRDLIGQDPSNRGLLGQEYEEGSRLLSRLAPLPPDWVDPEGWVRLSQVRYDKGIGLPGRKTTSDDDAYQRPMGGLASKDANRPMVVVLKKTGGDLEAFKAALSASPAALRRAPALIIDEEADDASLNYKAPKSGTGGWGRVSAREDRSAINGMIADLLDLLEAGVYVGYTATPFANCFADPDDGRGFYPHAIQVLQTPDGYFGATRVFDPLYDGPDTDVMPSAAHIRSILSDPDANYELEFAIDDFLLAGAVKLFRRYRARALGDERALQRLRHHTMMVHTETARDPQRQFRSTLRELLFNRAGRGLATMSPRESAIRLRARYEAEFEPLSTTVTAEPGRLPTGDMDRSWVPVWEELEPHVIAAIEILLDADRTNQAVLLVNSDDDRETPEYDADSSEAGRWCVLVGGHMLSRGFTVEGLTTVYFRRPASAMDTLLQLARWNGYRSYFEDLIRLYFGVAEAGRKLGPSRNLYQEFSDAAVKDARFRERLRRYAEEGTSPRLELPEFAAERGAMRPTAPGKMRGVIRRGGGPIEFGHHGTGIEATGASLQPILDGWSTTDFEVVPICRQCVEDGRQETLYIAEGAIPGRDVQRLVQSMLAARAAGPNDLDGRLLESHFDAAWRGILFGSARTLPTGSIGVGPLQVPVRLRATTQDDTLSSGSWNRWLRIEAGAKCDACSKTSSIEHRPLIVMVPHVLSRSADSPVLLGALIELPGRAAAGMTLVSGRSG
jgi:hypothetical protein